MPERVKVHCLCCELSQWAAERCSRCGKRLPPVQPPAIIRETRIEVREVPRFLPCANCGMLHDETPTLAAAENAIIQAAIWKAHGNALAAADALGIGKATIYRRLKKMGWNRIRRHQLAAAASAAQSHR